MSSYVRPPHALRWVSITKNTFLLKDIRKYLCECKRNNKKVNLEDLHFYDYIKGTLEITKDYTIDRFDLQSIDEIRYLVKRGYIKLFYIPLVKVGNCSEVASITIQPNKDKCIQQEDLSYCLQQIAADDICCDFLLLNTQTGELTDCA